MAITNVMSIEIVVTMSIRNGCQSDSPFTVPWKWALSAPLLILRLYTGCRLSQTLSKCIVSFKKVKVLKC